MQNRVPLAELPTPLAVIEQDEAGSHGLELARLLVKNDGVSGAAYGGNKVRKLEYLIKDAQERGATKVVTVGAVGSNHCVATLTYARQLGLDVELLQFPQPLTEHVQKNVRILAAHEVTLRHYPTVGAWVRGFQAREQAINSGQEPGTYWIGAGGTSPVGALGYVQAAYELRDQLNGLGLDAPAKIFVPAGTGGTVIGLAVGLALVGFDTEVIGVRVTDTAIASVPLFDALARETIAELQRRGANAPNLADLNWTLNEDFYGAGYGVPLTSADADLRWAQRALGLALEPTYTGKALAALRAASEAGDLRGQSVLYWMTLNQMNVAAPTVADARERLPGAYAAYLGPA